MAEKSKYYLTTPLYYVNAAPHLGHAYSTLVADTIRRFKRMQGYDAFLLTGNDEHGQNIERIARERGIPPKQQCDELSAEFRSLWERLGIQYDEFIRTTEDRHKLAVLELWSRLTKANAPDGSPAIYRGKYAGWYCPRCEEFKDEAGMREPDHQCVIHEQPCQWTEEENLFFRLSAYQDALLKHYEAHPDFVRPESRRNEVVSFVRSGLRDLSISRTTIKWGIPVPRSATEHATGAEHVFYVWLDALTAAPLKGIGEDIEERENAKTKEKSPMHSWGWYLRKYINDAKAKGATPVVCSLIPRKRWQDGKIIRATNSHADWARDVAKAEGVAFVDLHEIIAQKYEAMGQEAVNPLFADAAVHTSEAGAVLNAECVISGLKTLSQNPVAAYLKP